MAQSTSKKRAKKTGDYKAQMLAKTRENQAVFLEQFAVYGNIVRTCLETDIPRRTVYNWKLTDDEGNFTDPEFMKLYAVARGEAVETLEAEAWTRANEGVEVPVTVAGEREVITRKSDTLLIFLLKAHAPEKYRDRYDVNMNAKVEHSGQVHLYMPDNGRGGEE